MTSDRTEQVRALRAAGRSMTGVGAELGLTKGQVAGILHRQRHPKPKPLAPVPAPPSFLGLEPPKTGCRWTDSDRRPWVFCDAPVKPNSAWCPHHHAKVYVRPPSRYQVAAE